MVLRNIATREKLERDPMRTPEIRCTWLLVATVLITGSLAGCDSSSAGDDLGDCSIAYNSPDNSFARIVNRLDKHIDVEYASLPLEGSSTNDPVTCTGCSLTGRRPSGSRSARRVTLRRTVLLLNVAEMDPQEACRSPLRAENQRR